jgi:hypothetical protein
MDLLHTNIDQMVSPCMVVYGTIALKPWGLRIDRENFLANECPLNWIDPTNG